MSLTFDNATAIVCANNGISREQFFSKLHEVKVIEMCHFNLSSPCITGVAFFKNLTSLCIVAQDIEEMSGIEGLIHLEQLWICETKVTRISGLGKLRCLLKLFLYKITTNQCSYGNQIARIENLEGQDRLQVLWLSDNEIQTLENLEPLKSLEQFQCGNNRIRTIGTAFYQNNELQDIMLSGNRICSFREILNLVHLPKLTNLSLSDPNFDDNPISSLFNYQTHVILHLPKLQFLDSLQITGTQHTTNTALQKNHVELLELLY